ncbi:MAG: hypothetical protein JXR04_06150 [Bermanella sp.]
MARKIKKQLVTTLIVIGEGACEKAFLSHMKSLYDGRETGQKVTIQGSNGGSPDVMLTDVDRTYKHADYDRRVLLIDSDVPITAALHKKAKKKNIEIILSEPVCLEGMLLEILGERPLETSVQCKRVLHPMLSGPATIASSYLPLFSKTVLDAATKQAIVRLVKLLTNKTK